MKKIILLLSLICSLSSGSADIFEGLDNPRVLPMLQDLPYERGGMNIPAQDGRFLYDLIIEKGYRRGLEIGTSNGYSTLWLGLAFQKTGGTVITIEIEPQRAREARRNFKKAGLDGVIDSRINDAFKEIPTIKGEFDFIFLDAWKPDYIRFLKMLTPRIRPGGAITAHNVISQSQSMKDFLDALHHDPDLKTTIHKTSAAGISVSIVRSK
ncbi:O-methyltransferase [candidate division CSSED10-310 bacterium]|uniref:O-methyltransferase n=1 Tax=candidate division CSSED10-310 bacterium TaxID=2855610 RepID=A0ABV6YW20_UNCC1